MYQSTETLFGAKWRFNIDRRSKDGRSTMRADSTKQTKIFSAARTLVENTRVLRSQQSVFAHLEHANVLCVLDRKTSGSTACFFQTP
jgi:hypothetical protein